MLYLLSMFPWFRKKEETKETEKKAYGCSCEICRFSSEVDKRITDAETRERVKAFVWLPSRVNKIDSEKALEEAKKYENAGNIRSATESYSDAFMGALVKGTDLAKYANECVDFLEKTSDTTNYLARINDYKMLLEKHDVAETLKKAYNDFLAANPEQEKKGIVGK